MNRKKQTDELSYKYCPTCSSKLLFRTIENRQVLGCSKCSFIFWNNPRPVVSALIVQNDNVLLIKRKSTVYNGYWALPGGIIDYLEEPKDALIREVFEEAKVHVSTSKLIDAYLIVYRPNGLDKDPSHTSIDLIYCCEVEEVILNMKKVKNSSEIEKIDIFPIDKLPKLIAFKHRKIINKHLSKI